MQRHGCDPRVPSRRRFVLTCSVGLGMLLSKAALARTRTPWIRGPRTHPTPRPGITAGKVLAKAQLTGFPDAVPVFDLIREMPEIADGIRCNCGCAELPGFYSLLSCFESDGMAKNCVGCQGQARLVHRLHRAGRSLDEIRNAVDARFG